MSSWRERGAFWSLVLGGTLLSVPTRTIAEEFPLARCLEIAEAKSPTLRAAEHAWRAEVERADSEGDWPSPSLTWSFALSQVETRVGPQRGRLSLRQRIPVPGARGFAADAARESAKEKLVMIDASRLAVRSRVVHAWFDLYEASRALELTSLNLDFAISLERVVREKYRVGKASHADLVRAQVELGLLEDRVSSWEERLTPLRLELAAAMHRDASSLELPTKAEPQARCPDVSVVLGALEEHSVALRTSTHRIRRLEFAHSLAKRRVWSDWTIGIDWIDTGEAIDPELAESGRDPWIVSLGMELPLFRGDRKNRARSAAEALLAERATREDELDTLRSAAARIVFDWRDADRRHALYRDSLLPKAVEARHAAKAAYETGQGDFLAWVSTQRTQLEFELELERARADRGRSAARLERITGVDWTKEVRP